MNGRIRVLHAFYEYLHPTENWAFRLIDNLPDVDVVIASRLFLKNNFYRDRFRYIEFPVQLIRDRRSLLTRAYNAFATAAHGFYPSYVARRAAPVDLVHSHFSFVGWEYRSVARRLRVPHVVSFYGFDYERLPYEHPVWLQRYPVLFREADLFLCEGTHGASLLAKMGCPESKIRVARLGIDFGGIAESPREKRSGELRLVQIASFVEKKGQIDAARAFLDALPTCPNMSLTFVGPDTEGGKREVVDAIRGTAAESRVHFIERVDVAKLHAFLGDYQVFIHPSRHARNRDCEGGAPIVLLDAQATGMPVISTTHCDIPDEVVHGTTGLLTPERDVAALAESIRTFYAMDSAEYRQFARAAREHVQTNYDVRETAPRVGEIYRELLRRRA